VKNHFFGTADFTNGGDVIDHTNFVIDVHNGDQQGVLTNRLSDLLGRGNTVSTR